MGLGRLNPYIRFAAVVLAGFSLVAGMRLAAQFQGYSPGGIIDMDGESFPRRIPAKRRNGRSHDFTTTWEKSLGPTVSNAGLQTIPRRTGSS